VLELKAYHHRQTGKAQTPTTSAANGFMTGKTVLDKGAPNGATGALRSRSPSPDPLHSSARPAAIRMLIASGVRLYREGLAEIVLRDANIRVVGTAGGQDGVLASLGTIPIDLVLLDMAMANSVAIAQAIRNQAPSVRVVALTLAETEYQLVACAEAAVAGYVTPDDSSAELRAVVANVARGEVVCPPRIAAMLLRRVAALAGEPDSSLYQAHLSRREREVVRLIARGLSNKEIARDLGVEIATVKNHVHNILNKLRVHRRSDAAAIFNGAATRASPA